MKKWLKITLFILLGISILLGGRIGYLYHQKIGKYDVDEEKYAHYIGYLSNPIETSKFQRCDESRPYGWFASAVTYGPIFKNNKSNFKKNILENYTKVNNYENGFLNLRFIINCKGEVGNMEVNELDANYESTKLSEQLTQQLIRLSSRKENWVVPKVDDDAMDSYMYLIYKIENGEITEILP